MTDELMPALKVFYEETLRPEFDRSRSELGRLRFELHETRDQLRSELREEIGSIRRETNAHFDAVYHRFDRLETEYHMLVVAVKRIEESLQESEPDHS